VLSERELIHSAEIALPGCPATEGRESFQEMKAKVVAQFEKTCIQRLLLAHDGNITKAAQAARKNRRAFFQLMRKHRIDPHNFKASA